MEKENEITLEEANTFEAEVLEENEIEEVGEEINE